MRSKNEDEERKKKREPREPGRGGSIYTGSTEYTQQARTEGQREREQTYPEEKNETNSDGLEVNSRQEETDWRYLKTFFFRSRKAERMKGRNALHLVSFIRGTREADHGSFLSLSTYIQDSNDTDPFLIKRCYCYVCSTAEH